jgi:glycerophosphoryl diester phosphodiesterase
VSDLLRWLWSDESVARVQALGPNWEPLFQAASFIGVGAVVIFLVSLLALASGDARGRWLLLLMLTSMAVNGLLKEVFALERPHGPDIIAYATSHSYSLPSGHAQSAAALALALIVAWRAPAWLVVPPALLICLSRVYLGVHYPGDVLVGALVGTALAGWFVQVGRHPPTPLPVAQPALLLAAVALVGPLISEQRAVARECGALAGGLLGVALAQRWPVAAVATGKRRTAAIASGPLVWVVTVLVTEGFEVQRAILVGGYVLAGLWLLATQPASHPARPPGPPALPRDARHLIRHRARRSGPRAPV